MTDPAAAPVGSAGKPADLVLEGGGVKARMPLSVANFFSAAVSGACSASKAAFAL